MRHTLSQPKGRRRVSMTLIALFGWYASGASGLQAAPPKTPKHIDKALTKLLRGATDDSLLPVIVSVKPGAKDDVTEKVKKKGHDKKQDFTVVNAFSADLSPSAIRSLSEDSDVLGVSFDAPVSVSSLTSDVSGRALNSAYSLKATLGIAGSGLTGNNVTVAVIDSGIFKAPDFDGRIVKFVDFTQGGAAVVSPLDPFGHGTHVAGIIAGSESEAPGLAPKVKLVGLRVLDAQGQGSTSNVIAAIQWATTNKAAYKIDVINLSLGHPIEESAATDPLVQAVEGAVRAGIVVVVSAGNEGVDETTGLPSYAGILSPGNAPSAITVGAEQTRDTTQRGDDLVASYSSRGPTWYDAFAKPDVVAPGHRMLSVADKTQNMYMAYPSQRGPSYGGGKEYLYLSGTSMSAAVVSGSVALMIEAARNKFTASATPKPNAVKAMLMASAFGLGDDKGKAYDAFTQGAGALNTAGALTLAQSLDPRVKVGSNWLTSGLLESSVVDGQTISWAGGIVWGKRLYAGSLLYANDAAWDLKTVWGADFGSSSAYPLNDDVVWGILSTWSADVVDATRKQIVWGNAKQIVWGNAKQIVWGNARQIVWGNSLLSAASENSLGDASATR